MINERMRVILLTKDDRVIFNRLPIGAEFAYRFADSIDYLTTRESLRRDSVVLDVCLGVNRTLAGECRVLA